MKSQLIERTGSLKLVESKVPKKGCLGRLEGPCADFKNPTRNGRLYGLQLWKNVFDNKFVKEALDTKTLFGELDHPEDRFEVLAKYACVCMTDYTINESEGKVYGGFDILDTEQGRILKALIDYGSQMGVSSRGEGDIIQGENGEEVDPNTYDFACFDVVSTPAVAAARQTVVESVEQSRKKHTLLESIEKEISNTNNIEVLDNIERTVTNCNVPNLNRIKRSIRNKKSEIIEGKTISSKANNKKASLHNNKLSAKTFRENVNNVDLETISILNKKLKSYKLREKYYNNTISNYKNKIEELESKLTTTNEALEKSNNFRKRAVNSKRRLEQQIAEKDNQLNLLETVNNRLDKQKLQETGKIQRHLQENAKLKENINSLRNDVSLLNENIKGLNQQNKSLQEQVDNSNQIIESYKVKQQQLKETLEETKQKFTEQISNLKEKDTIIKTNEVDIKHLEESIDDIKSQYNQLVDKYNQLLENYNSIDKETISLKEKLSKSLALNKHYTNEFLTTYAETSGVNPNNIILNESITNPNKIKKLVHEVKDKQDRYNQLPISNEAPTQVNINLLKESVSTELEEDIRLEQFLTNVTNAI